MSWKQAVTPLPTPVLIAFEALAVGRGDRSLLSGLSGEIRRGEVVHLRGPNGIGKTTLLEVICGLRTPHAGTLRRQLEPEACHWVGHRNALHPALSPAENLRFWCGLNGADASGVRAALREFGLRAVADQPCRQLSAGQQRRTALARLAVTRRDLWLLDEPLSALDAAGTRHWLALLADHQARGGAALVTSHQALPASSGSVRVWDLAA